MKKTIRKLSLFGVLAAGLFVFSSQTANAQFWNQHNQYNGHSNFQSQNSYCGQNTNFGQNSFIGGFNQSGPVYHQPSVHFHKTYHPTSVHWTPGQGLHTHGHYDITPHVTPGHFDYQHGNHIHPNPLFHNH